jgi:hypothetical protein
MRRLLSSTTQPIILDVISSLDHTSLYVATTAPTVTLRKSGGATGAPSGTVSIVNGCWQISGSGLATDLNTMGVLRVEWTGTGIDYGWKEIEVVGADPYTTTPPTVNATQIGGTTQTARDLGNALPTAAPGAAGGLIVAGTGTYQLAPTAGGVDLRSIVGQSLTCTQAVTFQSIIGTQYSVPFTSVSGTNYPVASLSVDAAAYIAKGTMQSAGPTTIKLAAGSSTSDDYYKNLWIDIYGGGASWMPQSRYIIGYTGSTLTATVSPAWTSTPITGNYYRIYAPAHASQGSDGGGQLSATQPYYQPNTIAPANTGPTILAFLQAIASTSAPLATSAALTALANVVSTLASNASVADVQASLASLSSAIGGIETVIQSAQLHEGGAILPYNSVCGVPVSLGDPQPTGGTWAIVDWGGNISAPLAYSAGATDVQTALNALPAISGAGSVSVATSGNSSTFQVTFDGTGLAQTQPPMLVAVSALTGGFTPTVAVAETTVGTLPSCTVTGDANATGGTFMLSCENGSNTNNIPYNASASDVQSALNAVDGPGWSVSGSGTLDQGATFTVNPRVGWDGAWGIGASIDGGSYSTGFIPGGNEVQTLAIVTAAPACTYTLDDAVPVAITSAPTYVGDDRWSQPVPALTGRNGILAWTVNGSSVAELAFSVRQQYADANILRWLGSTAPSLAGLTNLDSSISGVVTVLNSAAVTIIDAVNAITSNTVRGRTVAPIQISRPPNGDGHFSLGLNVYTLQGEPESLTAAPVVHGVFVNGGGSADGLLNSTTMGSTAPGTWAVTGFAPSYAPAGQVIWTYTWNVGGITIPAVDYSLIVDAFAVDFTATDRSKLAAIYGKLPTGSLTDQTAAQAGAAAAITAASLMSQSAGTSLASQLSAIPTSTLTSDEHARLMAVPTTTPSTLTQQEAQSAASAAIAAAGLATNAQAAAITAALAPLAGLATLSGMIDAGAFTAAALANTPVPSINSDQIASGVVAAINSQTYDGVRWDAIVPLLLASEIGQTLVDPKAHTIDLLARNGVTSLVTMVYNPYVPGSITSSVLH